MRTIIFSLVSILTLHCCRAQLVHSPLSAGYTGIGTYSKNFTDVFSFIKNQAALSQISETMAGVYTERRYMLKELNLYQAAITIPLNTGCAGISAIYTGFKNYSESQVKFGYGRKLGQAADLGAAVNYTLIRIPGYGNAAAITVEIGSIFHFSERMHAGFHTYNPVGGKFGNDSREKLAAIYTFGLGYEFSDKLFISTETTKVEGDALQVNVAMHYAFLKQFFFRGAVSSAANSFLGVGLKWKNFRTDVSAAWHPQLGITPSFLIIFSLSPEKNPE